MGVALPIAAGLNLFIVGPWFTYASLIYNISTSKQSILRGDKDIWYKYSSIVLDNLEKRGEPKEVLDELLISHIIETRLFEDLMNILDYLYTHRSLTAFETKIKKYTRRRNRCFNNIFTKKHSCRIKKIDI